jgi:phage FluMu gp28-like protein
MQEWDARFVDDGTLFRNVQKVSTLKPQDPQAGRQYVIGVDWGRTTDATVFCVLDLTERAQVYLDRMTDTDFASQRIRLKALSERYNGAICLVETNSIGRPQLEALQQMNVPVSGFETTNATKAEIVNALQLALEQESIRLLDDKTQAAELMAYQSERLPSGLIRYNAPEGMHDDTVIALCLAWWSGNTSWLISSYE